MPWPLIDAAEPAVPGGEHDAVAERAEIEMHDRAGIELAVIGQHQRHRRVELAEAAQHPVLPHRLVVARNTHRAEQFLGDIDLAHAMHALVLAMADDVALWPWRLPTISVHVAAAQFLQRLAGQHVDVPGLRVHRRRRAFGVFEDLLDHRARHGCFLKPRTLLRDWTSVSNSIPRPRFILRRGISSRAVRLSCVY